MDQLKAVNSEAASLETGGSLDLDRVTLILDKVLTPATNNLNVGENKITFVEELWTLNPKLFSFKARKT